MQKIWDATLCLCVLTKKMEQKEMMLGLEFYVLNCAVGRTKHDFGHSL